MYLICVFMGNGLKALALENCAVSCFQPFFSLCFVPPGVTCVLQLAVQMVQVCPSLWCHCGFVTFGAHKGNNIEKSRPGEVVKVEETEETGGTWRCTGIMCRGVCQSLGHGQAKGCNPQTWAKLALRANQQLPTSMKCLM